MKNEIQKDDVTLPGGIGTVQYGSKIGEIIQMVKNRKEGVTTVTIRPVDLSIPPKIQEMFDAVENVQKELDGVLGIPESRTGSGLVQNFSPTYDYESFLKIPPHQLPE